MTHATARLAGSPLLAPGNDVARTDIEMVSIP